MKKSIFGFILAILLICPFMSQVLRAEARDTDSKVTDADKIFYYSFDNISGGLIADEWGSRNAVISGGKISTGKSGSALEVEKNTTGASVSNASVTNDAWTVSYWVYSKALSERSSVLMSSDGKYSFDAAISSSNLKSGVHVGTGSGDVLTFQYTLPAETWVHMTWTQDKTNGLSLYVNGTFVQTNTWTKTNNFPCPADLFGGSGSTLIASEQTNRICYTQELDPKYATAIIRRYIAAVGSADGVYVLRNGVKYPCSEVHEFSADELNIQDSNVNDAQRGRE